MSSINQILVVDDEASVCSSIDKILTRQGHRVDVAYSAEEAMQKIEQTKEQFKLVLADLMMPKVSGIELLKTIKSRWPEINVIMITGYASINTAVEATRLGAFDYIPKPFTPDELSDVTDRALESSLESEVQSLESKDQTMNSKPRTLIDVDLPFDENEVIAQTSLAYVESLTRSDIPVSRAFCQLGQRDCKKYVKKGPCEEVCPIVVREQKPAEEGKLPAANLREIKLAGKIKHPIDVDLPFDEQELIAATSEEYVQCLSRSDFPIIGLRRFAPVKLEKEKPAIPAEERRVLVVDDEAVVCNSVRKILATQGLLVDQAFDAIEALRKIDVSKYDMVILDLKMPKMDGIQLLRLVKTKQPDTVAVMITGYASIDTAVQATRLGAFEYLPKPFTPDELLSVANRGLALKTA